MLLIALMSLMADADDSSTESLALRQPYDAALQEARDLEELGDTFRRLGDIETANHYALKARLAYSVANAIYRGEH
jgi:hypothetical protein